MANITITRDTKANIEAMPIADGRIYFETDQTYNKIYTDNGTNRIQIGGQQAVDTSLSTTSTNPIANNVVSTEINKLNTGLSEIWETLFPVGYIFEWSPVSGSTLDLSTAQKVHDHFGFGTWQAIVDRTLIGAGSSYAVNTVGGSTSKSIGVANLPPHDHYIPALSGSTSGAGAHNHGLLGTITALSTTNYGTAFGQTNALAGYFPMTNSVSGVGNHIHTIDTNASTTGATGSGTSFDVMNPYKAVYIWQRVA